MYSHKLCITNSKYKTAGDVMHQHIVVLLHCTVHIA